MNAKKELMEYVGDKTIAYGSIVFEKTYNPEENLELKFRNHQDYLDNLDKLDFDYDNGYGKPYLFGTIVFTDNTWLERGEYDGSEWWEEKSLPTRMQVIGEIV